jgi:hypothetical protein
MIPPDEEIYEVEKRIAERRHRVELAARASARQAMRALTSPWALAGAAVIGFLAAGGVQRHRRVVHVERRRKKEPKAGAIAGVAMAAASWFIKSQFGSPVGLAQFILAKMRKEPAPAVPWSRVPAPRPAASPRDDRLPATTRR